MLITVSQLALGLVCYYAWWVVLTLAISKYNLFGIHGHCLKGEDAMKISEDDAEF